MPNPNSRVLARITNVSQHSTGQAATNMTFIVSYWLSGDISGPVTGELTVDVDITQNEAQIKSQLSQAVADFCTALPLAPSQIYDATDVRGCTV